MRIYLSPSDQTGNITATGHSEQEHCTKIAEYAALYLSKEGYDVKIGDNSRPKTYADRVEESNQWKADLHIPIHTNAGGGEGTVMFCHPNSYNNPYVVSICETVSEISPGKDRGRVKRTNLYEINNTFCTCAYLEVEFHDRLDLEQWIDENIENIGRAICNGVLAADKRTPIESPFYDVENKKIYRVQVGAFLKEENAHKYASNMIKNGVPVCVFRSGTLYRVQAGAFENEQYAKDFVKSLESKGITAIIK